LDGRSGKPHNRSPTEQVGAREPTLSSLLAEVKLVIPRQSGLVPARVAAS
jgi:hypothetical protein